MHMAHSTARVHTCGHAHAPFLSYGCMWLPCMAAVPEGLSLCFPMFTHVTLRAQPHSCPGGCLLRSGNGFFINTALTMLSVHASLWVLLLLAFQKENNSAVQQWLSAVQLLQLGSLSVVVYWLTLALEVGLFQSVWVLIRQVLQGAGLGWNSSHSSCRSSESQSAIFSSPKDMQLTGDCVLLTVQCLHCICSIT